MLLCEEPYPPVEYSGFSHTSDTVVHAHLHQEDSDVTSDSTEDHSSIEIYYNVLGTSLSSFFATGYFSAGGTTQVTTNSTAPPTSNTGLSLFTTSAMTTFEGDSFSSAMMTQTVYFLTGSGSTNDENSAVTHNSSGYSERNGTTLDSWATDVTGFSHTLTSYESGSTTDFNQTINSTTNITSTFSTSTEDFGSGSISGALSGGIFGGTSNVWKHSVYVIDSTSWLTGNKTIYAITTIYDVPTGTYYGTQSSTTTNDTGTTTTSVSTEDIGGGTTITFPGTIPTTTLTSSLFDSSSFVTDMVTTVTSVLTDVFPFTMEYPTVVPPGISYAVKVTTYVNWTDDGFSAYQTVYVPEFDLSNDDWFWSFYPEDELSDFLGDTFDWTDMFDSTSVAITIARSVVSKEYPVVASTDFIGGSVDQSVLQTDAVRVSDTDADPNPITVTITITTFNGGLSYDTDASSFVTTGGTTLESYAAGSLTTTVGSDSTSVIETQGSLPMLFYTTWIAFEDTTTVTTLSTLYITSTRSSTIAGAWTTKTIPVDDAIGISIVSFVTGLFGSDGGYDTFISTSESVTERTVVGISNDIEVTTSYDNVLDLAVGDVIFNAGYSSSQIFDGFVLNGMNSMISVFTPSFKSGFQLQPNLDATDPIYPGLGANQSMPYFDYIYQFVCAGGIVGITEFTLGVSCPMQWVEGGIGSTSDGTVGGIFGDLRFGGFQTFDSPFTYTGIYSLLDYGTLQTGSNPWELTTTDSTSWYFSWEVTRTKTDESMLPIRPILSVTSRHGTDSASFTNSVYGAGFEMSSVVGFPNWLWTYPDSHIGGLPKVSTNVQSVYISGVFQVFDTLASFWDTRTFEGEFSSFIMPTSKVDVIRSVKQRYVIPPISGHDGFVLETFHKHTVPL